MECGKIPGRQMRRVLVSRLRRAKHRLQRAVTSLLPPYRHKAQHSREKNRLYLQVITFKKDPSLALKNLPIVPYPTPVQVWGR